MLFKVQTAALVQCVPTCFHHDTWYTGSCMTHALIDACLREKNMLDVAFSSCPQESWWGLRDHAARIAWLVMNPCHEAIDIDFNLDHAHVLDGNHRLAAAVHVGQEHVLVQASGFIDDFQRCCCVEFIAD